MNNIEISRKIYNLIQSFEWVSLEEINEAKQRAGAAALSTVLSLLKQAKPEPQRRERTLLMEYIKNLYKVEQELAKGNYYTTCYMVRYFMSDEPAFEKRILRNLIDTFAKHEKEWTEWLINSLKET